MLVSKHFMPLGANIHRESLNTAYFSLFSFLVVVIVAVVFVVVASLKRTEQTPSATIQPP